MPLQKRGQVVGGAVMEENNNAHTKYEVKIEMCCKQNGNPLGRRVERLKFLKCIGKNENPLAFPPTFNKK